jgi:transglutaminase-like putative cysteine protease
MKLILETSDVQAYLKRTDILDYDHPRLQQLKQDVTQAGRDEIETARTLYEYVRDNIAHSADIDASTVTYTASDVLAARHGICCSKSHLLAALLRASGVPAGICYQKLRTDEADHESDLILHCLNAIYLHCLDRWIRMDARGNKAGVDAQFSTDNEQLAWPVRREFEEGEDPIIYANPWPEVVRALQTSRTRTELYTALQTLWMPEITARFQ